MLKFNSTALAVATILTLSSCDPVSQFTYQIKNETNEPIDILIVHSEGSFVGQQRYSRLLPAHSYEPYAEIRDIGGAGSNSPLYFELNIADADTFWIINANGDTLQKNHLDFANWRAEAVRNGRYYNHFYTFPVFDSDF